MSTETGILPTADASFAGKGKRRQALFEKRGRKRRFGTALQARAMAGLLAPLLILLFSCAAPALGSGPVQPLHLQEAYFIDAPPNSQLSGLTRRNGSLYTVSDRHDGWIFQIRIKSEEAALARYCRIELPGLQPLFRRMDFEGITHDAAGAFYLVSERVCRILKVPGKGAHASWLGPPLAEKGKAAGLFQHANAGLEGISRTGSGAFALCAEREPRGFLEVCFSKDENPVAAYSLEHSRFQFAAGRSPDFSGLYWFGGHLYVLERNAFVVCRLKRSGGRWIEGRGWSYRHAETDPRYRYADMRYGKAEGLCVDSERIYVLLDNNNGPLASDPLEKRPLLFIFARPLDF